MKWRVTSEAIQTAVVLQSTVQCVRTCRVAEQAIEAPVPVVR